MVRRNVRIYRSPSRKPRSKIPDALKSEITQKANELLESKLKPWKLEVDQHAKEHGFNYAIDLYITWWRNYLYFCTRYRCPGPNALVDYFESRFTRIEYVGGRRFNLSYMRHTGKWCEVYQRLPPEECLKAIEAEEIFWP